MLLPFHDALRLTVWCRWGFQVKHCDPSYPNFRRLLQRGALASRKGIHVLHLMIAPTIFSAAGGVSAPSCRTNHCSSTSRSSSRVCSSFGKISCSSNDSTASSNEAYWNCRLGG